MKILILLDSLAIGGGAERISTTLGDEFHNLNHEVHYLTFQDKAPKYEFKGEYHTLDQDNGQNIECKNIFKRGYNFVKNSKKITDLCKNLEIDTLLSVGEVANIHAVSSSMFHNNPALIIISQHINPLIHVHSKLKVRFINFFYSRASKTVCVSKEIETLLNRYFNVNNTTNINNMIDLEKINSLATEATDLDKVFLNSIDDVGSIFINIGSLTGRKGIGSLLEALIGL
jgi:glycosyltransferase involved in cell wall biosynthesis